MGERGVSTPEFHAGEAGEVVSYGVHYRVRQGRKGQTDLILDIRTDGWVPAPMNLGFLLSDFFQQNEDRLYPPAAGGQGGGYYRRELDYAAQFGWRACVAKLKRERERREAQKKRDAA
jgi:hypothetical protein